MLLALEQTACSSAFTNYPGGNLAKHIFTRFEKAIAGKTRDRGVRQSTNQAGEALHPEGSFSTSLVVCTSLRFAHSVPILHKVAEPSRQFFFFKDKFRHCRTA